MSKFATLLCTLLIGIVGAIPSAVEGQTINKDQKMDRHYTKKTTSNGLSMFSKIVSREKYIVGKPLVLRIVLKNVSGNKMAIPLRRIRGGTFGGFATLFGVFTTLVYDEIEGGERSACKYGNRRYGWGFHRGAVHSKDLTWLQPGGSVVIEREVFPCHAGKALIGILFKNEAQRVFGKHHKRRTIPDLWKGRLESTITVRILSLGEKFVRARVEEILKVLTSAKTSIPEKEKVILEITKKRSHDGIVKVLCALLKSPNLRNQVIILRRIAQAIHRLVTEERVGLQCLSDIFNIGRSQEYPLKARVLCYETLSFIFRKSRISRIGGQNRVYVECNDLGRFYISFKKLKTFRKNIGADALKDYEKRFAAILEDIMKKIEGR